MQRVIGAVLGWSRSRQIAAAVGVCLLVAGLVVVVTHALSAQPVALPPTPPAPSTAAPISSAAPTPPSVSTSAAPTHRSSLAPPKKTAVRFRCGTGATGSGVAAVRICIPAIRVDADVITTGLNADRTIQVPTLAQVALASWYKYSPAPGVVGPSIILGHVDSAQYGKGVFYDLGRLHSGDRVRIERADSMVATYRVDKVAQYPKSSFPTQLVYGDTARPTLRLITCGGTFDPSAGSYEDNIVAFGTLLSLRHR